MHAFSGARGRRLIGGIAALVVGAACLPGLSRADPQKALYDAVKAPALAPMLAALEQGARLEEPFHGEGISPRDQGWHALGILCDRYGGDSLEYVLPAILPYARDVNARQPLNSTQFMRNTPAIAHAAKRGLAVIKLLANAGADLTLEWQNEHGVTWNALDVALSHAWNLKSRTYYLIDPAPEASRFLFAAGLRPRKYLSDIALLENGIFSNDAERDNIERLRAEDRPAALAKNINERRREHAFQLMALADDPSLGTGWPNHDIERLAELGALQCVTVLGPADYSTVGKFGHPGKAAVLSGNPDMLRLMLERGLDPFLQLPLTSSGPHEPFTYWVYLSQQPEMIGVLEDFLGMEDRRPIWRALRAARREMEHLASVIKLSQGLDEVRLQNLVQPSWPAWTSREVMQSRYGKLQRVFRQVAPAIKDGDVEIIAAVLEDLGALPSP